MPRLYLPLLPLPVLAVLVAASACSKPRSEETTHVIPPAAPYAMPAAATPPPLRATAETTPAPKGGDDAPSAEEVKAFERPVLK